MPSLFLLRLCLFLDFVSLTIVIPLFAPQILNSSSHLLSASTSMETRVIILNALMTIYGIGQLIGSPLVGTLSDYIGRAKAVLALTAVAFIASLVVAVGFSLNRVTMLFIGRFWIGIGSAILAVLSAFIYDLVTDPSRRHLELGYLTGAGALGYIVGPFLGGILADRNISPWFTESTPLWALAVAYLILIALLIFYFKTDLISPFNRKIHSKKYFTRILHRFADKRLLPLFIVYLLYNFSTEAYFASIIIFSEEKFHLTSIYLGNIFAIGGLSSFICLYLLNPLLMKYFTVKKTFLIEASIMLIVYFVSTFVFSITALFIIMIIFSILSALGWTHMIDIICNQSEADERGEVVGVASSNRSLSIILGPLAVSLVANFSHNVLFIISFIAILLALLLFIFSEKKLAYKTN